MANKQEEIDRLFGKIREKCLGKSQGGLKHLSVLFRRMDKDFSQRLCYEELKDGMKSYGVDVTEEELGAIFVSFDRDKSKNIDFMELIYRLRPPMSQARVDVINEAFRRLDYNNDGVIKTDDLRVVYAANARNHPKFQSGEWTEEETLRNFLDSIDTPGCPDGKVTREEFMNYYAGVSATVDDDCYFDLMMRCCYGLPDKKQSKD